MASHCVYAKIVMLVNALSDLNAMAYGLLWRREESIRREAGSELSSSYYFFNALIGCVGRRFLLPYDDVCACVCCVG